MPRASGAKSSRPGLNGAGRSLQGVVPPSVCPGATECDESKCSSRLLKRCRMVDSSSTSSSSSSSFFLTDSQNSGGASERERGQKNPPKPTLFFLCSSRSPARTFSFSTHSLTSCSLSAPPSSGGVSCFALLLPHGAAHADPRREGGGEKLNAHLLPKIVYDVRSLLYLSVQQVR